MWPFSKQPKVVRQFTDADRLCALAALSEGAEWCQINEMFPGAGGQFALSLGRFMRVWLPDWFRGATVGDSAARRAAVRNYILKNSRGYALPEWAAEG